MITADVLSDDAYYDIAEETDVIYEAELAIVNQENIQLGDEVEYSMNETGFASVDGNGFVECLTNGNRRPIRIQAIIDGTQRAVAVQIGKVDGTTNSCFQPFLQTEHSARQCWIVFLDAINGKHFGSKANLHFRFKCNLGQARTQCSFAIQIACFMA